MICSLSLSLSLTSSSTSSIKSTKPPYRTINTSHNLSFFLSINQSIHPIQTKPNPELMKLGNSATTGDFRDHKFGCAFFFKVRIERRKLQESVSGVKRKSSLESALLRCCCWRVHSKQHRHAVSRGLGFVRMRSGMRKTGKGDDGEKGKGKGKRKGEGNRKGELLSSSVAAFCSSTWHGRFRSTVFAEVAS